MICKKCGAEIQKGYVYCSACGSEVQLVPDYNLLDEDVLGGILRQEAKDREQTAGQKRKRSQNSRKKSISTAYVRIGVVVLLFCVASVAVLLVAKVWENQKNSYGYQYQKAMECFLEKEYDEAESYCKAALSLAPGDAKATGTLLDIYVDTKREEEAAALLEERISEDASNRTYVERLVALYDKMEAYDKILALCDAVKSSRMMDLFEAYLVEQPRFSNISGTYHKPLEVELFYETEYDVFYTTDGQDPTEHGMPYRGRILLKEEGTTTFLAVARNQKGIYSRPVEASYTIRYEAPELPEVTPAGGTYDAPQKITVSVPQDCTAYYTWDGSDPSEASFRYTGPLEMQPGNQVLSVILVNASGLKSGVYRVNYIYMP